MKLTSTSKSTAGAAPKSKLTSHLATLRASATSESKELAARNAILFWGSVADKTYLPHLKGCVGSATCYLRLDTISTVSQVSSHCKQKKLTKVVTTSIPLLKKLLNWDKRKQPNLKDYAGSYFTIPGYGEGEQEIEVVFIQPLKQLVTVTYGKFLTERYVSKLVSPEKWMQVPKFNWKILIPTNEAETFLSFSQPNCFLVAVDVETFKENATIRCLSYTAFWYDNQESSGLHSETVVLPLDSTYALAIMRKWNWELQAPKLLQNGKYDHAYFARYNAPCYNYLYDTATMFHSWYSELPKDLGFLNSFFVRESVYWKDLAETNDLHEYYRYNALDTWGTGNAFLAMLLEIPGWAMQNYVNEFPLLFPCHMAEMRGIARDTSTLDESRKLAQDIVDTSTASLNTILDVAPGTSFNVNSPPQMKQLLAVLGCGDLPATDEKNLRKARFRHPFNARIINHVLAVRKARKLISTYFTEGKEFSRLDGTGSRVLYSLNPHGTDSGRLASKSHHFWCGLNIQNIPRGPAVKRTMRADPGFLLCEVDLEQAESRDTAYISGDETLIHNVEYSPDFHSENASSFFGVPFESIFDIATGQVVNKPLRQLGKPVNHGANYNMGPIVLIETMGEENIIRAKNLLGLPSFWSYKQVAEHLLEQFHRVYPGIRGTFYKGVVEEILTTGMLKHHIYEQGSIDFPKVASLGEVLKLKWVPSADTLTRYCFGHPDKNKQHLNSYIAHPPQALNAVTLNKAWLAVYKDIAINPKYRYDFKLLAQIHDSIFFQYRIGHEYLCDMVEKAMEIPVTIKAYDGKIRTFTVPASAKKGTEKSGGIARYWSETE